MKKNLVKKLALSAVTMGVAALTVTTTTFAWFTSNTSATASSIKATTVGAGEGNLLISTDGKNWATTAKLTDHSSTQLAPTQLKNGEFKDLDGTSNSANTVSYTLYFSVSNVAKGAKIQMNLSDLKFGADTEPTISQKLLADAGSTAKAGSTVSVKYGDVLAMRIEEAVLPSDATAQAQEGQPGTLFANNGAKNYRYRAEDLSGADAVTYYNNILGKEIERPGANDTDYKFETTYLSTADSKIDIYQLGAEQDSAVFGLTFTFFIDGWDAQCFNAVSQGSITDGSFNFNVLVSGNSGN
jgi:hypothetical protein